MVPLLGFEKSLNGPLQEKDVSIKFDAGNCNIHWLSSSIELGIYSWSGFDQA